MLIRQCLTGPDLYLDTDYIYFNADTIQSQYRPIGSLCLC